MFGSRINGKIFHLVLICDENGIHDAFRVIKDHLTSGRLVFLSLVYVIPKNDFNPLYDRELSILEKRFAFNLSNYILRLEQGQFGYMNEYVEAIINSNTTLRMQFAIFGNEVFVKYVSEVLQYLNVDRYSIELKDDLSHK